MKRFSVLFLAVALFIGFTGSVAAANPFADVPANHWAYTSLSKLATAGIVDGYGDGTFAGSSTMTRYEMAQIVAKAMTKSDKADAATKAQLEKLAVEFAAELDTLGVRVAKLEKNSDNVKITGEIRISDYAYDRNTRADKDIIRTRLWLRGQVNDNWSYTGMLEHDGQNLRTNADGGTDANLKLRHAWVNGKVGDIGVTAGRFFYKPVYGLVFSEDADGLKFNYSKNAWKLDLFVMRPTFTNPEMFGGANGTKNQVSGALLGYDFSKKLTAQLAYYNTDAKQATTDSGNNNIFEFALGYQFDANWRLFAEYLRGDQNLMNAGKNGWAAQIDFGAAKRNKPGSYSLRAGYYDVPASTVINTGHELDLGKEVPTNARFDGFKGWMAGVTFVASKNIDLNVEYFDFKSQTDTVATNNNSDKLLWSYARLYF